MSVMKIAVLGTGVMGAALAELFISAGHDVIVYNRSIERTAPLIALGAKRADRVVRGRIQHLHGQERAGLA